MFHGSRRCIAMVAATSIGILITACSSSASSGSAAPAPPMVMPPATPGSSSASATPIAPIQLRSARMADDYSALDRGILIYAPLKTLHTGVPVELSVTVIDIGRGPQLTSAPTMYQGEPVDPYDVATSADVVVQIYCSSDLTCLGPAPKNRESVSFQHEGYWGWLLTAQNPGRARINIV